MRSVGCRNRRQACAFFFTNSLDLWGSVKVGFPVSGKGVRTVHTDIIHIQYVIPYAKSKKKTPLHFLFLSFGNVGEFPFIVFFPFNGVAKHGEKKERKKTPSPLEVNTVRYFE